MSEPFKKEFVPHQVIEDKLLVALGDGNRVGALFDADDLDVMIEALRDTPAHARSERWQSLLDGFEELRKVL